MKIDEIVLLVIYAVAAADGKLGNEASRIVPYMLRTAEEDIQAKVANFDEILDELKKYPKEAIESVISVARFVMHADGIAEESELDLINKLRALLK